MWSPLDAEFTAAAASAQSPTETTARDLLPLAAAAASAVAQMPNSSAAGFAKHGSDSAATHS
eukprot:5117267-Pleurochrysis_carterae.AAC.1